MFLHNYAKSLLKEQRQMELKALVLLGYRNTGKDSICKALQESYSNIHNAKFGAYNKELAAHLTMCGVQKFEDKQWREQPMFSDHSFKPTDLLNALFAFTKVNKNHRKTVYTDTFGKIPFSSLPVFTDIRREEELNEVIGYYGSNCVVVFWLNRIGQEPSEGDEDLPELISDLTHNVTIVREFQTLQGSLAVNIAKVKAYVEKHSVIELKKTKPVLHLFTNSLKFWYNVQVYEPLAYVLGQCQALVKTLNAFDQAYLKVFNTVVQEIPLDKLELADAKVDSQMVYIKEQHEPLLPKLREKFTLVLHLSTSSAKLTKFPEFTQEEIKVG